MKQHVWVGTLFGYYLTYTNLTLLVKKIRERLSQLVRVCFLALNTD
jgi:hypothetical protein